jgi:hypothetical protein
MLLNLKKFITKEGDIKSPKKIKKKIRKAITNKKHGKMDFVETFVGLAELKGWVWAHQDITVESVIELMTNYAYKIVEAELKYFIRYNSWKQGEFCLPAIGTGRIMVRPVDFEATNHQVWLEIEFCTTL